MNAIDLIFRCKNQDRKAQGELYLLYKNKLFVLCLKYCRNYADAEDVLQETFITIFEKIENYSAKGSFEGWMKRIAINKAIDKYKDTKIRHLPIIDNLTEDVVIEDDLSQFSLDYLLHLIQQLPNQYRLVFSLYELDNYTHKEIATLLKISVGTSKSNLHRAKLILKEKVTLNHEKYGS